MGLAVALLSVISLAAVAPAAQRMAGRYTGLVLALLPAGLTVYFLSLAGSVADGEAVTFQRDWVPGLDVSISFYLDGLSLLFALLICGIGALVLVYAGGYLGGHHYAGRFHMFMLLFMTAMLGLVLADNVVTLFVFWELTSISSYLLIGFDHERAEARRAALQALLVTGAGGLALLAGLLLLAQVGSSSQLSILADRGDLVRHDTLYVPILLLVLAGAFTKSAQVPFHFWLPNAMEAPTPVSAYLHSATMVKAGIYLVARLSPVLGGTDTWLWLVTGTGAVTMLIGAHLALQQVDLKRILAYSTVSALGMLMMLFGLGEEATIKAAVVILLGHALYKGALFLVAGAADHETGERDVTRLGGLRSAMPMTGAAAMLAGLSMAGVPPLFGFIAKESLYESVLHAPAAGLLTAASVSASILLVAAAGNVSLRPFVGRRAGRDGIHEAPIALWAPPMLLAVGGLTFGLAPVLVDSQLLTSAAEPVSGKSVTVDLSLWHGFTAALGLSAVTLGAGLAVYLGFNSYRGVGHRIAAASGFGADQVYDRSLDALNWLARTQTRLLQSGYLRFYILTIVAVTTALAGYTFLERGGLDRLSTVGDLRFFEVAVVALIAGGTVLAVLTLSRLTAVAALGAVGYGVALVYLLFGAPDLAMAQILVETLLVIVFILVIYHLPRFAILSSPRARLRDAAFATAAGALMTALVLVAAGAQRDERLTEYYAENSKALGHGKNVVNVILVDFRSLDTLGEIAVLAVAGMGVFALLKLRARDDGQ